MNARRFLWICLALLLLLSISGLIFPQLSFVVPANASSGAAWLNGWTYRKSHVINPGSGAGTNYQIKIKVDYSYSSYYDLSTEWTTVVGDPTDRHNFEPVHKTNIVEVDKVVDGATRKYLAYDCNPSGSQVRLYYTDNLASSWTTYSGNPILSAPSTNHFAWPSVVYDGTTFHMFIQDNTDIRIKRYTSTDGIKFTYQEDMVVTTNTVFMDVFPWFNPNDNKWYLYHQLYDSTPENRELLVRSSSTITGLRTATDSVVMTGSYVAAPSVMYRNGYYWLTVERGLSGSWKVHAFRSTSPVSGFEECGNSPILSNNDACPIQLLSPDGSKAYLYTTHYDGSNWYEDTREIYSTRSASPSSNEVDLNSHSRSDFGDIRFTDNDGSTLLDYWMEEKVDGGYAVFWVKVADDLSSASQTIYIYYGKSDAATTSNGKKAFLLFDDFNDGSLNYTLWSQFGTGTATESGGVVTITATPGGNIKGLRSSSSFGLNTRVRTKTSRTISGTDSSSEIGYRSTDGNERVLATAETGAGQYFYIETRTGGVESVVKTDQSWDSTNHVLDVLRTSSGSNTIMIDGAHSAQSTTHVPTGSIPIALYSYCYDNTATTVLDWVAVAKYVNPEPSHGSWGSEETQTSTSVMLDKAFASDARADVSSVQKVGFHAGWSSNGSDIVGGTVYVNGTGYVSNGTGWINVAVSSPTVMKATWVVTGVNCNGVTVYSQTAQNPSIIWDDIKMVDGGVTKGSVQLGDTATVWIKAEYEYDAAVFTSTTGLLYLNGSAMSWSTVNNRWEYSYATTTLGDQAFTITGAYDNLYQLAVINNQIGAKTVDVWYNPFSVVSNSTISTLSLNSTSKVLSFIASGPTGTQGYANVTIAKTLIENVSDVTVFLDGSQISYAYGSTDYYWVLQLTYHHSSHKIVVNLSKLQAVTLTVNQYDLSLLWWAIIIGAVTVVAAPVKKKVKVNRLRTRAISICLALLLLLSISSLILPQLNILDPAKATSDPSWLNGWTYRKSHVINPASGAGTNYQVEIRVHNSSGTDSGADVYLNGNSETDFGDIRFTDDDGSTLLDYWVQDIRADTKNNWNKTAASNPVLSDASGVSAWSSVLKVGSVYHMYYTSLSSGIYVINHATSTDGKSWTKDMQNNPVLQGTLGQWDGANVWSPMVWKESSTWYMLYTGMSATNTFRIGLATSTNGLSWSKSSSNPVLSGTNGQWDQNGIESWGIIKVGSTYYLWYNSYNVPSRQVGLATSTNLVTWTKNSNNPIFATSDGNNEYFCAFPFQYGNYYYLLVPQRPSGYSDYAQITLYRDTQPTFYRTSRQNLGVAISYSPGDIWDSADTDTPFVLTDNVQRNSFSLTNNELWCYYEGQNHSNAYATGLTIEKVNDVFGGNSADIWVSVNDDLSSTSQAIYVYYGKSDATTTSNGAGTFLLFDDFNDGSLSSLWSQYGTGGTVSESGTTLTIAATLGKTKGIASTTSFGINTRVRSRSTRTIIGDDAAAEVGYRSTDGTNRVLAFAENYVDYPTFDLETRRSGGSLEVSSDLSRDSIYHVFDVMRPSSGLASMLIDGAHLTTSTASIPTANIPATGFSWSLGVTIIDWIAVTRYVSPEPSHGSWGSQETSTTNVWASPFSVVSNSTVSALFFNSTSKVLSFTASGPSGTHGYANVTIAKTLIADISGVLVYLNGNQIGYALTSTDYYWMLRLTYSHSAP